MIVAVLLTPNSSLPAETIDTIVESRPGSSEFMRSPDRILRLLSRGNCYEVSARQVQTEPGSNEDSIFFVKFPTHQLDEIGRLAADIEPKGLPLVTETILKSFDGKCRSPHKEARFVSQSSLDSLAKIGFVIPEGFPNCAAPRQYLSQLCGAIQSTEERLADVNARLRDIEGCCLRVIGSVLADELEPPIEDIVNAGLVDAITARLVEYWDENLPELLHILNLMLKLGTTDQNEAILRSPMLLPRLRPLLALNVDTRGPVLSILSTISKEKAQNLRITKMGFPSYLIDLCDDPSCDDPTVPLDILVSLASCHPRDVSYDGILKGVCRTMSKENQPTSVLENCVRLLHLALDRGACPNLLASSGIMGISLNCLKATNSKQPGVLSKFEEDLAYVIVNAAGLQRDKSQLVEQGVVSVMGRLLDSNCLGALSKSLPAISKILAVSTVRRSFIDSGVLRKLLRYFKNNVSKSKSVSGFNLSQVTEVLMSLCYYSIELSPSDAREVASLLSLSLADDNAVTAPNAIYTNYLFIKGVSKEDATDLGLDVLVKPTLRHLGDDYHNMALEALKILIPLDASHVDLFLEGGGLDAFSHLISSSSTEDRVSEPICEIINFAVSREMVIQKIIDCDLLSRLINNLRSPKYRHVLGMLKIVAQVLNGSAGSQAEYLASLDCIGPICSNVSSDDTEMATLALETLKDVSSSLDWLL